MASPTPSLLSQIPMENQKQELLPDEEEEVLSLQRHCSSSSDDDGGNNNNNTTSANTALLVDIFSTNGNENANETRISSLISSSSNNNLNEDSETPKVGVSSPCTVSPHKHSGDDDKDKDESEERAHHLNSVYFDQHHGADSINGASGVNCGGVTCSVLDTSPRYAEVLVKNSEIQKSLVKDDNLQLGENMDNKGFSGSGLTPLEDTFEEHNFKSKPSDSETRVVGDLDLIEEIDQEMTEFDVEKVLEKQNTHDLYCPNCNSCITRRVILRRRRWKNRNARRKPKHAKVDTIVPSESNGNSTYSDANSADSASGPGHDIANICSNDSPTSAVDDHNCDREPDVFRCLSCFSFFIPAGNGFKLFRVSSTENENVQDPQKISTANTNWFFSIFATHKRKTTTEQGILNNMGGASLKPGMGIVSSSRETKFNETALISAREKSGDAAGSSGGSLMNHAIMDTVQLLPYSSGSMEGLKENAPFRPQGGVNPPEYSTSKSLIPEQSEIQIEEKFNMAKGNEKPLQNGQASSTQGTSLSSQLYSEGGFINDAALKHHEVGKGSLNSLSQGTSRPEKENVNIGENEVNAMENKNIGNDVIVTIEKEPPKRGDSEIVCIDSVEPTSLLNSTNQTNASERKGAGVGESWQWEILKSIVYGGLIESITSLGVVSSAAGAGAGTLNIIALGLANLIGGLFIIGHNLVDLKNDRSNQVNEQEDRYQETLGRRDNFSLHATLSILSFLIFGLLPPVMYGFSFRKSDDRDLKLAAVDGASLFCIILLAIGKAHIQRKQPKPYISTVLYFLCIGLMASGASYVVGDLISKLLQKISGFESNLPFPELKPTEPTTTWASY